MDIKVDAKADLTPVLNATPKGFDRIFRLVFPTYTMNTERFIELCRAQNLQDIKKIEEGKSYFDVESKILIEKPNHYHPIDFIQEVIGNEEAINLLKCSVHASEHINEDHDNEVTIEIDPTFINRWRREATSFSTDDVQEMWGKILAEEINQPSSISLRSLDVLKNISTAEAKIFDSYCEHIIFNDRILEDSQNTNDLDLLAETGLIHRTPGTISGGAWPSYQLSNQQQIYGITRNKDFFWIYKGEIKDSSLLMITQNNLLTSTGRILYNMSLNNKVFDQESFGQLLIKTTGLIHYIYCSPIIDDQIDFSKISKISKETPYGEVIF